MVVDNPTVSVIMPTYNRAHMISKAIQTVLDQTYRDFEFIIVDDGSKDNTEEVVSSFKDERIKYIRLQKNSGTSAVPRNTGIGVARGRYLAMQDDDTEWHPQKLEKQIKAFESAPPEVGVVATAAWVIRENRKTCSSSPRFMNQGGYIRKKTLATNVLRDLYFSHPTVLSRRECFEKSGVYDEKLSDGLDTDMWIRMASYYEFRFIGEPLVSILYSSATTHYNEIARTKGRIALLNKHFADFVKIDGKLLASSYFRSGLALCLTDNAMHRAEGRRCLRKALMLSPFRLDYRLVNTLFLLGLAPVFSRIYILLTDGLRPALGWAYPFLNKVYTKFY